MLTYVLIALYIAGYFWFFSIWKEQKEDKENYLMAVLLIFYPLLPLIIIPDLFKKYKK